MAKQLVDGEFNVKARLYCRCHHYCLTEILSENVSHQFQTAIHFGYTNRHIHISPQHGTALNLWWRGHGFDSHHCTCRVWCRTSRLHTHASVIKQYILVFAKRAVLCIYIHTYVRTYVCTYVRTLHTKHTYVRIHTYVYIRTIHTIHTNIIHTYINTYIHTYIHTMQCNAMHCIALHCIRIHTYVYIRTYTYVQYIHTK